MTEVGAHGPIFCRKQIKNRTDFLSDQKSAHTNRFSLRFFVYDKILVRYHIFSEDEQKHDTDEFAAIFWFHIWFDFKPDSYKLRLTLSNSIQLRPTSYDKNRMV